MSLVSITSLLHQFGLGRIVSSPRIEYEFEQITIAITMSDDQERGRALKRKAVPSPRTSTSKDRKSQKTYDADEYAIRDIGPVPDPDETSPFPDFSEEEAAKHTVAEYEMRVSTPDRLPGQGDQPFTRGVIEPLLHEASAERKKRNFMVRSLTISYSSSVCLTALSSKGGMPPSPIFE